MNTLSETSQALVKKKQKSKSPTQEPAFITTWIIGSDIKMGLRQGFEK